MKRVQLTIHINHCCLQKLYLLSFIHFYAKSLDYVECPGAFEYPGDFRGIMKGDSWDNGGIGCVKVTNRNIGGTGSFVVKAPNELLLGH